MEDIRQNKGWEGHLRYHGWKTVRVKAADGKHSMQVFILRLGWWPFSMMKVQRSNYDPDFRELAKIKRKYWVANSIIEPIRVQNPQEYKKAGYRLTNFPYLAMSTYLNDLTKSESDLWRGLSENAKRLINKNKETVVEEMETEKFCLLWKKYSKIWIMKPDEVENLIKIFKGKVRLVVSRVGEEFHSGLVVVCSKDTANYYQTWTSEEGRRSGAHYKLVWEEMLRAKKDGMKYFDFEGVFDSRWPQKRWKGFTEFKRRFGGELVQFPGGFFRWL
jgi:lipid II:glycine glycyltransferase (peptidoglycan interpeptide bridge formation enzyme)